MTRLTMRMAVAASAVGLLVVGVAGGYWWALRAAGPSAPLATVTMVDVYRRHVHTAGSDHHYLRASRIATAFWGVYAIICAQFIKGMGSLVEAVNVLGSLFYGGMLGVFVLARA
jgi:hypothetical protein